MKIKEIIEKRVSVRTFAESRELDTTVVEDIKQSISNATTPFGDGFTIDFKKFDLKGPQSPSTHRREVEWYADKLCISPKYLSDVCRKCSGRPASEWIKDYVMFDIRSQLKNSTKSIKEISNRLGFSSLTFFGKCIRRWFGQSPTELREHLRNS